MLTIRLQRTGKKNASSFRIVVAEKAVHVSKKVTEVLGHYNPSKKEFFLKNPERLHYWLGQHVTASPTVHNLLISKGIVEGDKVKAFSVPKKETPAEPGIPVAPSTETMPESVTEEISSETPAVPTEEPTAE